MVYIINMFEPGMIEKGLQARILEFPTISHFKQMFNKIAQKSGFKIHLRKDIMEMFCNQIGISSAGIIPGQTLNSEDLENGDIAFYIELTEDRSSFRYFFISIRKPQMIGKCHVKTKL